MSNRTFNNIKILKRVLLSTCIIVFFGFLLALFVLLFYYSHEMKEHFQHEVEAYSTIWEDMLQDEYLQKAITSQKRSDHYFKEIQVHLSLLENTSNYPIYGKIISTNMDQDRIYTYIASTGLEEMGYQSFSTLEVPGKYIQGIKQSIETKENRYSGVYKLGSEYWVSTFVPILNDDGNIHVVVSFDTKASYIYQMEKQIVFTFFIVLVITLIGIYYILKIRLRSILEPVEEIIKGINEVSNGNFQVKLNVKDESELSLLVERFNNMTEQLSILFDRLTCTAKQLGNMNGETYEGYKLEKILSNIDQIAERTKLLKELQRAEKMNAIGQMAASVAHEIRNPMTVVKGFLQIFLSKENLQVEEKMYVGLMIDEMNRAETIINEYLSLAKPDIESVGKVDGGELVNKVVDLMNSYAMMSKNLKIATNIEEDVFVKANRGELQQVLINIIKNGIEAMKDGGTLTVEVKKREKDGIFTISDTGIGMTPEELERLGTPFYSLKEKGTGIGLMVCYQIVERMKGKIDVTSKKGEGTTFEISIPLYKEERDD